MTQRRLKRNSHVERTSSKHHVSLGVSMRMKGSPVLLDSLEKELVEVERDVLDEVRDSDGCCTSSLQIVQSVRSSDEELQRAIVSDEMIGWDFEEW